MTATATKPAQKPMSTSTATAAKPTKQQAPIDFELTTARYNGALFNIPEEDIVDNGPLMSGSVTVDEVRIPLSAFFAQSKETGTEYMNLSLGSKDGVHYHGRLFRNTSKKSPRSPDYTGFVTLLAVPPGVKFSDEEWDEAVRLQVFGRKVRNADNSVRIELNIAPQRSLEPVGDDEVAF